MQQVTLPAVNQANGGPTRCTMGEMLEYSRNFWSGEIQVSVMVHLRLRASTSFLNRQLLFTSYSRTRRSC